MFTLPDPVVEWRKMRNHLSGFQDPEDLETFRAGAFPVCFISPNSTLWGNESYRDSMASRKQ